MNNNLTKYIFTPLFKLILWIFSFIFTFGTISTYRQSKISLFFNELFNNGLYHAHFFSILELFFIIIVIRLLLKYKNNKDNTALGKFMLFLTLLCFVLNLINPNNSSQNPIFGLALFSDVSYYTFILLVYFSFNLKKELFIIYIKFLFYYISVILTGRVIFLFILWVFGKGNMMFGANSTLVESDTLFLIAFFQVIYFMLFLINKNKKKYLLLWLLYLLFQLFSYRRSALGVAILSNSLLGVIYFIRGKGLQRKLLFFCGIVVILMTFLNVKNIYIPARYEKYVMRFISAIPGVNISKEGEFSDSGHWEQTMSTFSAIRTLGFWGIGYGHSKDLYVKGQSAAIHNSYVAAWASYGVYMFIFYLFVIFFIFFKLIKIYLFLSMKDNEINLICLSISVFLLCWFAVLTTNPLLMLDHIKMKIFWITLFAVLMRIKPEDKIYFSFD